MSRILANDREKALGVQLVVIGVLADPSTTGLAAADITGSDTSGKFDFFYIKIDSAGASSGTTGALKIRNIFGNILTLNYNVQDAWYPEPIAEIIADGGNLVKDIVYGVSA